MSRTGFGFSLGLFSRLETTAFATGIVRVASLIEGAAMGNLEIVIVVLSENSQDSRPCAQETRPCSIRLGR